MTGGDAARVAWSCRVSAVWATEVDGRLDIAPTSRRFRVTARGPTARILASNR